MHPDQRDAALLWDILEAAREIRQFTAEVDFAQYAADKMRQRAVEREVEIIGEAARRLSDGFKQAHPEIPWRAIVAQRHVLAHEYGEIRQDRIWAVATVHIPRLMTALEPLLPPLPPGWQA
jgi:uncharacterized protein with HEPN domain